jgi:hypothetical protein
LGKLPGKAYILVLTLPQKSFGELRINLGNVSGVEHEASVALSLLLVTLHFCTQPYTHLRTKFSSL